jgi:hypothetical protein
MTFRKAAVPALIAALITPVALMARQNIVKNGSMEYGEGPGAIDPQVAAQWAEFGVNVERSPTVNLVPPGPGHSLKAFGDGDNTSVGASQEVADIEAGDEVTASVQLYSPGGDQLGRTGEAGLVLEFLNIFGGTISLHEVYVLNAFSPADTWIPAVIGPLTAPENTAKVRVACRLKWNAGEVEGAAYWDDAQLIVNDGANALLNGDFETAGHSTGQSSVGIDDWIGFNDQEKSEDVAESGVASLKLGTREPYSGLYQNMGVLNDGDHIFMIAHVWNPSEDPLTANSQAGIKLEFDPNAEVPPPVENLAFDETANVNEWTLVDLQATVPEDITIARIVCIYTGDQQTTGAVYFDAVYAERNSAPGFNQLLNPGFEMGPGGQQGLTDWHEFFTADVSQARKSCFSVPPYDEDCTCRAAGQAVAGVSQEIAVAPGEDLYASVYLYSSDAEPLTGPARAGIKIEWAVGGVPDDVDIGGPTNTINAAAPVDTWIPVTIDFTMPAGSSALARFTNLIEKGTAFTGTVYFDSCEAVVLNRFDGSDVDGDNDEDMFDFAWFQLTYTGPGAGALPWNGIVFDADDDQDVDMTDFEYFAPRMTGPALIP